MKYSSEETQLQNRHQPNAKMRFTLLVVFLASTLLTVTLGKLPSRKCSFVPKRDAKNYFFRLSIAINKCDFATYRALIAPEFKFYGFNAILNRDQLVSVLRSLCAARIRPRFKFRIIARQDPRSFIVEVKVFRKSKLAFTLNNNYVIRRRRRRSRRCPKKLKTCYVVVSNANHLRVSDFSSFGLPK